MRQSAAADHVTGQRADRRALAEIVDLVGEGMYDAASVLAWELQRTSPGDPNVWLLLARIDHLRERYAAAIYAARMATRLDPSSADAWIVLAETAVRRERWWTEGLDAALQATALTPDDAEPWTVLARLQLATGQRYDAAVSAERAVRIDDDHRGAHVVLGQIALESGEWRHAAAAFRRALELDGDDPDARAGLATALEAQDIDPADELARYGTPVVLRGRGRNRTASGRLRRLRSHPLVADSRRPLIWVAACLVAGLLIGAVVPALGPLRGLVSAVAVVLMWFAVRPLRTRNAEGVDVAAADAARDEVVAAAADGAGDEVADVGDGGSATPATMVDRSSSTVARERHDPVARSAGLAEGEWGPAETSAQREHSDEHVGSPDDAVAVESDVALEVRATGEAATTDVPADDADADPAPAADAPAADDAPAVADGDPGHIDAEPEREVVDLPHDPDALIELSRDRLAASDLEVAHAAASRLEAIAPGTVEAHRALGAVALAEHDYDQAREHYSKVLELEPLDQEAHERLALIGEQRPRGRMRRLLGWR
jgi:cytochrome c-type biogenesis protein CcmH/NrfG